MMSADSDSRRTGSCEAIDVIRVLDAYEFMIADCEFVNRLGRGDRSGDAQKDHSANRNNACEVGPTALTLVASSRSPDADRCDDIVGH